MGSTENTNPTTSPETPAGATAQPAPAAVPADPLAAAKQEAAANYDRYVRSVADLENFRRRTVREKDELRSFAIGRVLEDIIPVLDNLALGLTAARQPGADLKTLTGGVDMVLAQLKAALAGWEHQDSTVSSRIASRFTIGASLDFDIDFSRIGLPAGR